MAIEPNRRKDCAAGGGTYAQGHGTESGEIPGTRGACNPANVGRGAKPESIGVSLRCFQLPRHSRFVTCWMFIYAMGLGRKRYCASPLRCRAFVLRINCAALTHSCRANGHQRKVYALLVSRWGGVIRQNGDPRHTSAAVRSTAHRGMDLFCRRVQSVRPRRMKPLRSLRAVPHFAQNYGLSLLRTESSLSRRTAIYPQLHRPARFAS